MTEAQMKTRDGAALLSAILQEPGVDLHRLAFADWLEEGGEAERGELIRVQLEIASHECWRHPDGTTRYSPAPPAFQSERYKALRRREGELLAVAQGHPDWIGFDCSMVSDWRFSRGLVSHVTMTLADFTEANAGALFRAAPLEGVRLTCRKPGHSAHSRHGWYRRDQDIEEDGLPVPLWESLAGGDMSGLFVWYATQALAQEALSRGCARWGRRLAGLPVPQGAREAEGATR